MQCCNLTALFSLLSVCFDAEQYSRAVVPLESVVHVGQILVVGVDEVQPLDVRHRAHLPVDLFVGFTTSPQIIRRFASKSCKIGEGGVGLLLYTRPWVPNSSRDRAPGLISLRLAVRALTQMISFIAALLSWQEGWEGGTQALIGFFILKDRCVG